MTATAPSRFLRLVLRVDAFAVSRAGTMTLIPVLIVLAGTGTAGGCTAAGVLFAAVVAAGVAARRHERAAGASRS